MPQFVILTHDWPDLHWDFMLESNGVLKTWRLQSQPTAECELEAIPIADHRLHYLTYEGPVSMNRGTVHQFEHGEFSYIHHRDETEPQWPGGLQLDGKTFQWNAKFIREGQRTKLILTQRTAK